jgi:hypothetical protein
VIIHSNRFWLAMLVVSGLTIGACGSSKSGLDLPGGTGGGPGGTGGQSTTGSGGSAATDAGTTGATGGTGIVTGGGTGGSVATGNTQCSDGIDNDGDGKIDLADPECVSPLDNDESSFATGIPGDNVDPCKQDCFFDGNSGMGDDHCDWNLKCDSSNVGATAVRRCEYDPNASCPGTQSAACLTYCGALTPNGCDCFGCCVVPGSTQAVRLSATCTAAKFNDPSACSPCTQTTSCVNDCKPCELCLGKTVLPASCTSGNDGGTGGGGSTGGGIDCGGLRSCGLTGTDQSACPTDTLCISGCCVPWVG